MTINIERSSQPMDELLTIQEFATKYGLVITVRERDQMAPGSPSRFYASFENCEVKEGSILVSSYGNGATPEDAVKNYAEEIQGALLIVDAMTSGRRELWAHILVEKCHE